MIEQSYPCLCCGHLSFGEPLRLYEICLVCYWEDDLAQLAFPDLAGGANNVLLLEGQQNFIKFGACEKRFIGIFLNQV